MFQTWRLFSGCPARADVAFLLDSSGSVGRENFNKLLTFTTRIIDELNIDRNGTSVAMVTYNTVARVWFHLHEFKRKDELINTIMGIRYHYGDTNTAQGLWLLRDSVFKLPQGDRQEAQNIAILLTDGVSNVRDWMTLTEAHAAKDANIHILAVGIGLHDTQEIRAVASHPADVNMMLVDDFDALDGIVDPIVAAICAGRL